MRGEISRRSALRERHLSARAKRRAHGLAACLVVAVVALTLCAAVAGAVDGRVARRSVAPVSGLTLTGRTTTSIDLYWVNPSRVNIAGIIVRRAPGTHAPAQSAAGVPVPAYGARPIAATDTRLVPGAWYSYAVFVRDGRGGISRAARITVRTDAIIARPLATPQFSLTPGPRRLILNTFGAVTGASAYSYRLCNGADAKCGPRIPVSVAGRVITGLISGARYTIRLMAIGDGVSNADSPNAVRAAVPAGLPLRAARLVLSVGPGTIRVDAFPSVAHATGYRYRLCDYADAHCSAATPVARAGATIRGLTGGATYTVELTAHGDGKRFADSPAVRRRATVSAIPLVPPNSTSAGCAATTIAQENSKAGGIGWQPPSTIGPPLVQGFAQYASAACGSSVGLYLGTQSTTPIRVRIEVWRLGYYQGSGGRLVWTTPTLSVSAPPTWETVDPATFEVTAPWPRTATLTVPHNWTQGMYELRIVPVGNPAAAGAIPLVIRDDTRTTPIVQIVATNTDQMYNQWGNHSAYSSATGISTVVSLIRPYDGFGTAQILDEDYPLARFVESQGRDISYLTDVDLDYGSPELAAASALVVGSHSEYWTPRMRANLEAALNRGANVAFFGANNIYWHAVPTTASGRYTQLNIWKLNKSDPNAASPTLASTMWRLAPISDPEQKILGEQFGCTDVLMPMTVPANLGWVFAGTGATPGQQLQGVIYQETDTPTSSAPMPVGTRLVTAMTFPCPQRGAGFTSGSAFALVPQAGGGLVVNVGTRGWVCLLDGSCVTNPVYSDPTLLATDPDIVTTTVRNDPTVEAVIRQATTNILNVLLGGPAASYAHDPSYPLAPGA